MPPAPALTPDPAAHLRGELLEFLKFRVLASQDAFFGDLGGGPRHCALPEAAAPRLRGWLRSLGVGRFEPLGDGDLLSVLEAARRLYLD